MTISNALNNAVTGLNAASRMAEVVSSNLANAMTDGYGKRTVDLSADQVGGRGAGVRVEGIVRTVDPIILNDRRLADADLSGQRTTSNALKRLESALGADGNTPSLATQLVALEEAFVSAASDPSSDVRLNNVLSAVQDVANSFNHGADTIQSMRLDADAAIKTQVEQLNQALSDIEKLNADVSRAQSIGGDTSGLLDQRQQIVDRIATFVPIREMTRQNGQIALMTTSGQMLIDGPAREVGFTPVNLITADMTFTSGGLSGLTLNGDPLSLTNGIGKLDGGSLGANFALRDKTLVDAQTSLDAAARDLVERFSDPANDTSLALGQVGLFTDNGTAFDPANTDGLSARLAVNPAVEPENGGDLWRLRDGVGAAAPGPEGSSAQLSRFLTGLSENRATMLGGRMGASAGHAADFLATIGSTRVTAEDRAAFSSARWSSLREAELSGGVDTDQELQNLMLIEKSYAANARLIQTLDVLMRALLEI